jgi:two-component system KDP operon response regulator KdpE
MPTQPDAQLVTTAPCILVIDDEPQIRSFIDISLRAQGYTTRLAANGKDGLSLLTKHSADLVILDLGLPDLDGQDVLKTIRLTSNIPVIILTVRDHETQKVALLDAGANDYVTKPFGIEELMARIRVLLRLRQTLPANAVMFDDGVLRIDLDKRLVTLSGEAVSLTRKEFALLSILVKHPNHIVTQSQLLKDMWGPTHEEDVHYLRILVGKLRHKLGDDALTPKYIVTEPGVGLRFLSGTNTV